MYKRKPLINESADLEQRRHDLDWLRVIAFGLLIFYHIGMFYVTWDFHVKSVHVSSTFEPLMKLLNPWRLSLLFLISGMAIRFAIDKLSLASFTWRRSMTLLIPIVFGMLVVVAPQSWLELLEKQETASGFTDFYLQYLGASDEFSIIVPTWNHLWYVVYIFVYTIILVPFARLLSSVMRGIGSEFTKGVLSNKFGVIWLLMLPVLIFYMHHFFLRPNYPSTHALVDDWANHQLYFMLFLTGFLIAKDAVFWETVRRALVPSLLLVFFFSIVSCGVWFLEGSGNRSKTLIVIEFFSERIRKTGFAWFAIVALLSMSQRWLNRPSLVLNYMNQAIFSWYILHQTLIVMIGYWLTRQGFSFYTEVTLLVLITYAGCYLIHEYLIRRYRWIRPLFGMKLNIRQA